MVEGGNSLWLICQLNLSQVKYYHFTHLSIISTCNYYHLIIGETYTGVKYDSTQIQRMILILSGLDLTVDLVMARIKWKRKPVLLCYTLTPFVQKSKMKNKSEKMLFRSKLVEILLFVGKYNFDIFKNLITKWSFKGFWPFQKLKAQKTLVLNVMIGFKPLIWIYAWTWVLELEPKLDGFVIIVFVHIHFILS